MDLSHVKVLIVDDLGSARKILAKLLGQIGVASIDEATNGEEAYQKSLQFDYSVIISDWEMPRMTGIELLRKLRGEERSATLPFILVTSLNQRQNVIEAIESGTSDYIGKPFTQQTLKEKLEKILSSQ